MDIADSWHFLEHILCGGTEDDMSLIVWMPVTPTPELKNAVHFLCQPGMSTMLEEWLYEIIFQNLSDKVSLRFWDLINCKATDHDDVETTRQILFDAFDYLYDIYNKCFLESVRRLKWLQTLAVSAPAVAPTVTPQTPSAFTSVKSRAGLSGPKGVRFQQPRNLSQEICGNAIESVVCKDEENCDGSVETHEEKDEKMELGDENMQRNNEVNPISEEHGNMDGSYVPDKSVIEQSLVPEDSMSSIHPDSSFELSQRKDMLFPLYASGAEDEDDESFIRSPIGGSKKSVSAPLPSVLSGAVSDSPFAQRERCQTSSRLPALSSTSTPGMVLTATPGQLTPIMAAEATPVLKTDEGNATSHNNDEPSPEDDSEPSSSFKCVLPEASLVFGTTVPARPVPGQVTDWPAKPGSLVNKIHVMLKAILFYTIPKKFSAMIKDFYSHGFEIYKVKLSESDIDEGKQKSLDMFDLLNSKMDEMGLMESISGSAITEVVHSEIEKHIEEECKGNFDTTFINDLEAWLDQHVLGWLKHIYAGKQTASQLASVIAFRDRLRHSIYETYGKSLIAQFFDIIIDFPDSKPAILDLSKCLEKSDLRSELVSSLKNALESRLLHPGVNTAVILTAYIAAIKSLRLLEPAGVILELVCEPVGRYLRSREDTVRCIVASLTDDGNNELVSELVNTKPCTPSKDADEEDGSMNPRWEEWMPDPVDADPSSGSRFRRSADILSTLVNIYGSKELFVNEYRSLLADRILMQYNYDVERELRYLELLKLRFGEAQLHFCEVMLRDVSESRRVNSRIQEACKTVTEEENNQEPGQKELELNAMILSAQFWPAFRDEKIKLPVELQEHLDKYTRSFEQQKQNRTLVWKPHLGVMNIELELNGETLSFSVSPVQAAIIMKFQEKNQWSLESLSHELEMTPSVLRRKLAFWQGQGLVRESVQEGPGGDNHQIYTLVEERSGLRGGPHDLLGLVDIEEEAESAMASAQQQKEEEMQMLWTYIQGMLANLDCLTLERIHAMLRMFATEEPGSEISLQELKAFLDNKVKDQILVFAAGVYRLNK
ncbi:anaphase-promoting complex subunit 2 [Plakobranchus ocellatus]|uniref:Anaphase-promoting complex subunit 2 n=1 Tax=Plakobranchus ocellatus TaxID=259542 RepID=A0AAV3Z1G1_9GAST|nr:anaphase-promoting complex subunit 2 [Plakobranchus ocellatus]